MERRRKPETYMTIRLQNTIDRRDAHVREMVEWHFNPETGSPFWLSQVEKLGFDPRQEIKTFDDLTQKFPLFDGDLYLRTVPASQWKPRGIGNRLCSMYVTGGTTGRPKRRLGVRGTEAGFSDVADDYREFAAVLSKRGFAQGGTWLYIGPQGPRRLKRGVEIMADVHQSDFVEVDMDVAWMKNPSNSAMAAYKRELVDRAIGGILRDRPDKVFCPPILIQAMAEQHFDWATSGVKGVFAGGTEMSPETVRFINDELFGKRISFVPTFGNALVGLAIPRPLSTFDNPIDGQDPYQVIYQALEPRTSLQVTKKGDPKSLVAYGEFGYLLITTLSKTWFMPNFLERDWAKRIRPTEEFPWDGVAEIQVPPELKGKVNVGVY